MPVDCFVLTIATRIILPDFVVKMCSKVEMDGFYSQLKPVKMRFSGNNLNLLWKTIHSLIY